MGDRSRYDSAMFWLAFGTAASVIGLALMTIGVSRSPSGANLLASPWFDGGLALLVFGGLMLVWALGLYLRRRRDQALAGPGSEAAENPMTEAVKGYYSERDRLFKMWDRQQRNRARKK
jgi:hypothetical protein